LLLTFLFLKQELTLALLLKQDGRLLSLVFQEPGRLGNRQHAWRGGALLVVVLLLLLLLELEEPLILLLFIQPLLFLLLLQLLQFQQLSLLLLPLKLLPLKFLLMSKKQQLLLLLPVLIFRFPLPLLGLNGGHLQHLILDLLKGARPTALGLSCALLVQNGRIMRSEGAELSRSLARGRGRHTEDMALLLLMGEMKGLLVFLRPS
jgi:hypothetical protein